MDRRAGELQDATPESASPQVKVTVTLPLFHPLALGAGLAEPVIVGGVRSMLTGPTAADAKLPALSVQVPVTLCPEPCPRVVGPDTYNVPDSMSEQLKLTVTVRLFQPFAFGGTDLEPMIVGAVRSMLMLLTVADAELPALSRQVLVLD